ncbi:MAG TPA: TonB-dependent receptor [Gammaproteobacteria bacterium]
MMPQWPARLGLLMLGLVFNALAQNPTEEELSLSYGDEEFISIATGQKQLISKAPAVATVITAEDIKAIGATDLDEVLETVPGLHVAVSANKSNPIYTIRGIYSDFNPQVLVLINGIPITNVYLGNRSQVWGGMPVKNIARIEVIRGPGSAIYGADAFAGVINIITKSPAQIDGTVLGARVGSFNTLDSWLLHSGTLGDWDTAFSLQMHTTEAHKETVEIDAQTLNDQALGTSASLAPSSVDVGVDSIDTRLELENNAWKIRLGFQGRYNFGTYAGVAEALDPAGTSESERFNADITYHNPNLNNDWDFTAQASYFDTTAKSDLTLFPPGTDFTGFGGGPFPDGVIGNPYIYERHYRIDVSAFYTRVNDHDIRLGSGYHFIDMYRIKDTRNFTQNEFGVPVPIGNVVNVSDTMPFITEEDRNIVYFSAQDEWSFAPDWKLTAGVRFDNYSDFGNTTNPRAALVWQTRYNMATKLLYGRAFRAPSFAEQFNINNPVALGNPDLDPETIDTLELAFDFSVSEKMRWSINIFAYEMDDIIQFVSDPAPANSRTSQNTGGRTGRGVEWDFKWQANDHNSISVNYAFQDSEDEDTNSDTPNAPGQQLYFRHDLNLSPTWSLHTQINHVADRKRAIGDLRNQIDDYTKVDIVFRRHAHESQVSAAIYISNVLDETIKEPSLAPGAIFNDLPRPPRAIFGEIAYHW